MAYDLEEQEQLASLKAFWNQYGNLITWILIAALATFAGYNFWNRYQASQAGEASVLYGQLQEAIVKKDAALTARAAGDLESKYGKTAFAQMGALAAAKAAFEANDLKTAKAQLQWAIDHGDDEYQSVARLRLSGVLLDEKNYAEADKVISTGVQPQFAAEVSDRKGDILVAQNKLAEARTAYEAAYKAMAKAHPGRQLVQVKLESIGGTVPADPATETKPAA
ncbi:tetratricopeptide repeat protein [Massilia arenosa]|uniref:Ancillary SecYEG translocon subunit n=1 Tax=Zemynaea arenosa TaxID=2561931 RepID=A0A4Y9SCV0_9BURK|nr:tetratricopeptide repeat protein [Massilia arenosa]TFW20047.1 tetratricopeptide repeat protein [Massilia arenosa]